MCDAHNLCGLIGRSIRLLDPLLALPWSYKNTSIQKSIHLRVKISKRIIWKQFVLFIFKVSGSRDRPQHRDGSRLRRHHLRHPLRLEGQTLHSHRRRHGLQHHVGERLLPVERLQQRRLHQVVDGQARLHGTSDLHQRPNRPQSWIHSTRVPATGSLC